MQLLVLGCHRSGTSACTRLLNMMGASVGAPESMKAANKENPKGFWENDEVVDINKLLLQQAGARWDRLSTFTEEVAAQAFAQAAPTLGKDLNRLILRFDVQRPWVTKDPRLCLTLPFWLPYLEQPVAILMNRHPVEVAHSMNRRNPLITLETGVALWEKYTLQMLRDTRDVPRVFIAHEAVMRNPVEATRTLLAQLEALGVTGLRMPSSAEITAFIDAKLHRERRDPAEDAALMNPGQLHLLAAMESGEALAWNEIPELTPEAQQALETYDAATDSTPERLLAANRWNMSRMLELRAENETLQQRLRAKRQRLDENEVRMQERETLLHKREAELNALRESLVSVNKLRQEHDDLRAKYSKLFRIERDLRQEVKYLRSALSAIYRAAEQMDLTTWWQLGVRLRLLIGVLGLKKLRPQFPIDRAKAQMDAALLHSEQCLDSTASEMQGLQSKAAASTSPNRKAFESDIEQLEKLFVRMARCNEAMDNQWWWRAGITARKRFLLIGAPRDRQAISARTAELWKQASTATREAEGRSRRSNTTEAELLRDRNELGRLIEEMYGLLRRKAGCRWWRWGTGLRKGAGALGLLKPDFRLPPMDAEDVLKEYKALQEVWRKQPQRYTAPPPKPSHAKLLLLNPGSTLAVAPLDPNALYFDYVQKLQEQSPDSLTELVSQSEEVLQDYRRSYGRDGEHPLVSIIMPAYNRSDVIGEALRSVLEQTWQHWELWVCDDGSADDTVRTVQSLSDPRIHVLELEHGGAAKARNAGLAAANGEYIAYLDSDNIWHPAYLEVMVGMLVRHTGHYCAFTKYLDVVMASDGGMSLKRHTDADFNYENLQELNFIDLNSFVHRASLYREFGGFTDELPRMQDWDLVLKYTFLRDPLYVDAYLTFYRRNEAWGQITHTQRHRDDEARALVRANLDAHYETGMPVERRLEAPRKVTILVWDICRNHFSKAYNLAEALHQSGDYSVQLIGFRFFEEPIFEPYEGVEAPFETLYLGGAMLPDFERNFARALMAVKGDLVYCVKPRFPSLGLGLLANYHFGKALVMESNDSEVHVHHAGGAMEDTAMDPASANPVESYWKNPHGIEWSRMMDGFAQQLPFVVTHNVNLDAHYGSRSFYIRNLKDEAWYDPARYDRDAIRAELGFKPTDRVILFGGLIRKHKGVFTLVDLVQDLGVDKYKLLFVGSRNSPDLEKLKEKKNDAIVILPPQGRNDMAKINYAADLVVLWLDPEVPASRYQMPYKLTDALAMKVPVIANDISDMGRLGEQGYLKLVPHGDMDALKTAVRELFDEPESTRRMTEAGRRLYLRQFSYAAAKRNFDLVYDAATSESVVLPASGQFAEWYARVHEANATEGIANP